MAGSALSKLAEKILFATTEAEPEYCGLKRGEALSLAQADCTHCLGLGLVLGRSAKQRPCNCVFRGIFRICHTRFRGIVTGEHYVTTGAYTLREARAEHKPYSHKHRINEEYAADFFLLSKRTLADDPAGWKLFRLHFLLGAPWNLVAPRLGISRGEFFHEVYRIQQRLGRAYAETLPYGIYPVDEYFGGTIRKAQRFSADLSTAYGSADAAEGKAIAAPLRAPLRPAA